MSTVMQRDTISISGKAWVGDLCYLLGYSDEEHAKWMKLLHDTDFFEGSAIGVLNGETVLAYSTMHGDGVYMDQFENEYPVDAGLIGVAPLSIVPKDALKLGAVHEFANLEVTCSNNNGRLRFGHVLIDTDF